MRYKLTVSLLLLAGICFSQRSELAPLVSVRHEADQKRVSVTIDAKPFTSYYFPGPGVVKKPVLYPVYSPKGNLLTRGWPLDPRTGERVDHPHHIGIWFNYEDINGNDFWNNSTQVNRPGRKFGTILNTRILETISGTNRGTLTATSDWVDHSGKLMLTDTTRISFLVNDRSVIAVDYDVVLTAGQDVVFGDIKDGLFAIRLARELELKYDKPETLTGADGKPMAEKTTDNAKVSGSYRNTNGLTDDDVWGEAAAWCAMTGTVQDEVVTVALLDHPYNIGYPAYWHARGYGLFALNSLARRAYDKAAEPLGLLLAIGESARFRYRVVVASGALDDAALYALQQDFSATH